MSAYLLRLILLHDMGFLLADSLLCTHMCGNIVLDGIRVLISCLVLIVGVLGTCVYVRSVQCHWRPAAASYPNVYLSNTGSMHVD